MRGHADPHDGRWTDDELRRRVRAIQAAAVGDHDDVSREELLALMVEILDLRSTCTAAESAHSGGGWSPSPDAARNAGTVFVDDLPELSLTDLSRWLVVTSDGQPTAEHREIFADAIVDLRMLLDEVRFETGLAAAYVAGLTRELTAEPDPTDLSRTVGIPTEALALLVPFHAQRWTPSDLFSAPGTAIPGNRILGGWFAGQLLDSALIRAMAALDRLPILLWAAAQMEIKRDEFRAPRLPAFRRNYLDRIAPKYQDDRAWAQLYGLLGHEFMGLVKPYRDGLMHRRRAPTALHGEYVIVPGTDLSSEPVAGFAAWEHLAIALGFYAQVLTPAIALTGRLLAASVPGLSAEDSRA